MHVQIKPICPVGRSSVCILGGGVCSRSDFSKGDIRETGTYKNRTPDLGEEFWEVPGSGMITDFLVRHPVGVDLR